VLSLQIYVLDVATLIVCHKRIDPPTVATIEYKVLGTLHDKTIQFDDFVSLKAVLASMINRRRKR
jgi:hypothetical protein